MSLAPGERQALARIAGELRRSDPALADRLQTFGGRHARWPGTATVSEPNGRRWPQVRRLHLLVAAVVVLLGVLWGLVLSTPPSHAARKPGCMRPTLHLRACPARGAPAQQAPLQQNQGQGQAGALLRHRPRQQPGSR